MSARSGQLDLFEWTPTPAWRRPVAVLHRGCVRLFTRHVDGEAVYRAARWDYAAMRDGSVQSVNWEESDWFSTVAEASVPFGRETAWPDFARLRRKAAALAATSEAAQ